MKSEVDFKVNFILNKAAPSVLSLFEEVIESLQAREVSSNKKQMTFVYHNQVPVSVLISKDDVKIRIQSPVFEGLWFIVKELLKRLLEIYGDGGIFIIVSYPL